MLKKNTIVLVILAMTLLGGKTAWARGDNPPPPSQLRLAEKDVKQLILMLDKDRNGKVSKQEFMNFMSAEFDRLDKDKSGELDVRELKNSKIQAANPVPFSSAGK